MIKSQLEIRQAKGKIRKTGRKLNTKGGIEDKIRKKIFHC